MLANITTQKQLVTQYQRSASEFGIYLEEFYNRNKDLSNINDLLVEEYIKYITGTINEYGDKIEENNSLVAMNVVNERLKEYDIYKGFALGIKENSSGRIRSIATNESKLLLQRTPLEVAKTFDYIVMKTWNHSPAPKVPRETHLKADGQIKQINEDFVVGGKKVEAPGKFGDIKEDIYCSCFLTLKHIV
jgi:hypothetical protein